MQSTVYLTQGRLGCTFLEMFFHNSPFRLECYSCKMVTADKRSYRNFINTPGREGGGNSLQPLSPPSMEDCVPTFKMCDVISNKTLFYLIETLNASFPDYTFFNANSETPSIKAIFTMYLWPVVDSAITLAGSVAYSYLPLSRGDPYTEPGCIWSFNHIIFNRSLNRILFFSCRAMK
ncbi:repressor of RNA polymerase III transcription [Trichuris trichiura]|uniref:Repressor of RNA polymerase III transcription MAF1 homolog n=1 Tax=Trichuris trichiura TaxID=36087 RepID=A0A077ZI52_TRITR|nr:repressor of RNA polymerase III transcription [Trichuris trichiura]